MQIALEIQLMEMKITGRKMKRNRKLLMRGDLYMNRKSDLKEGLYFVHGYYLSKWSEQDT